MVYYHNMWGFDGSGLWVANTVSCKLMLCKSCEIVEDDFVK